MTDTGKMYEFSYDNPKVDACNIYGENLDEARTTYIEWYLETFGNHILDPENITIAELPGDSYGPIL